MDSSAFMDNLRQLFSECDTDGNGILGRDEFTTLCAKIGLSQEAASETFERLDIDKNDGITFEEFAAGFNQYKQSTSAASPTGDRLKPNQPADKTSIPQPSKQSNVIRRPPAPSPSSSSKLSPSPVASRARKSVSPISATGSSSNLFSGGRSSSGGYTATTDSSSLDFNNSSSVELHDKNNMVVYSSDLIAPSSSNNNILNSTDDYDQYHLSSSFSNNNLIGPTTTASGSQNSGQFESLISNNSSSLNQVRNMQDLLECVQKLQSENQILTQIFFKDKREREEYISQLGEEFDQQVREVEERANKRAKEELEAEKKRLRDMMAAERETLQHHYQTIEKMSNVIKSSNGKLSGNGNEPGNNTDKDIDKVRSKLEDTYLENRQLKKSLLDTKTDVAMIWKEMERLKKQYEDKLSSAYERNIETRSECDHIKQQLSLMKDSNRKLQDASDVITNYITDKVEPVIKNINDDDHMYLNSSSGIQTGSNQHQSASRKGSILSEYFNGTGNDDGDDSFDSDDSMELSKQKKQNNNNNHNKQQPKNNNNDKQSIMQNNNNNNNNNILQQSVSQSSITSSNKVERQESLARSSLKNIGRHFFIGSSSSRAQSDTDSVKSHQQDSSSTSPSTAINKEEEQNNILGTTTSLVEEPLVEPADGPSKATFNIILVGDSFVGKTSFAARFMEGSFVQGLISNCSIDFKTKTYKVDGVNYTVNLWDTAGQERFRSITASYFRKADGIILMYDVTDKRSYLNVRNWMSTIHDTASENVAVLLIGNKIDLRETTKKEKCVPAEEGLRLANEYDIVFLETSVKTGTNLIPSMGKLIRLIAKNNSPEEEDTDRIRLNDKSKMFNCMPKNC